MHPLFPSGLESLYLYPGDLLWDCRVEATKYFNYRLPEPVVEFTLSERSLYCCSCGLPFRFNPSAHQAVEFLGKGDIASDLHAPLQCSGKQISSPFDYLHEVFLAAANDAVCFPASFVDGYHSIINRHKPVTHLLDVEKIGAANTPQQRFIV